MKVVFPKHIQRGLFGSMSFNIGPFSVSIIQLFILAMGVAAALGIFNGISQNGGSRALGIILAIPVLGIFILIGFFKLSELGLLPFLAKKARNNFFDTTKKFQVNYQKISPLEILLKKGKVHERKQAIEHKSGKIDQKTVEKIESSGLLG